MSKFWQKEIGGVLGAVLITSTCTPVLAGEYQRGYSHERTCFKSEYREEYIPGTESDPGYVKSWKETVEVPCESYPNEDPNPNVGRTSSGTYRRHVTVYEDVDTNDCSDGTVAGGLLGGGLAGFGSRGKDRWWAIPAGIVGGAMVGCAMDGG
tara:strand:- start:57 stop:512 length:456 start_codon:yes stop_codon:yes gene_type:complete